MTGHGDRREPPPASRLFSAASADEHARVRRRLWWALPAALAILGLVVWLGPSADEVERKFTPYGTEGPLRILPEISIEEGEDLAFRRARREAVPPPPAPDYQVEPDRPDPRALQLLPDLAEQAGDRPDRGELDRAPADDAVIDAGDGDADVDLSMPSQHTDSDFIIRKLVRPLYPARATAEDRRRPLITVEAAFYLDERGEIVAVMVQSNDGGPEFAEAVRAAMSLWEFAPRLRDGVPPRPRWLVVIWRFRSPFSDLPPD
ncbi:MAG TPA: energy transducer TonB [Candidatus Krumholzibacteria bacterium]|nr:energy transducer TonB [Candidatus Krumholzibacteria bacterium]HPD72750.1 energy transducer TonB [Candidatus Krumholzibacteria bacterium]HRY40318.1 energy transducer TonB [Candidatus Krumholzibacteria bacterium]